MKNLILIGMPGCGKSTVGVLCAKALGMPFLDTDLVLQSRSGRLLQSLVNELGTEGFLRLEEEVILGIACESTVLATGGSVALEDRAIAHLRRTGVSVYLRLPYAEIEHRLRNIAPRGIAMETLWVLASGVIIIYLFDFLLRALRTHFVDVAGRNADIVLDCAGQNLEETVSAVVAAFRAHAQGR